MTQSVRVSDAVANVAALPGTPLAQAALNLVTRAESASIANHSIRSYLFARLVAGRIGMTDGRDYDDRLLFLACVLHALGLAPEGKHTQRFEVAGADAAAEFLTEHGLPAAEVDSVWEAIALHTTEQIGPGFGLATVTDEEEVLRLDGLSLSDLVEVVSYHPDMQANLAGFLEVKKRFIKEPFPAWSMIGVASLANPDFLLEVRAVAAYPDGTDR